MTSRRGVALVAALGVTASLGVAVPLAVAKKGDKPGVSRGKKPAKPRPGKPAKKALFEAVLNGRNAVDANRRNNAGDPDGQGIAAITVKGPKLCFGIVTQGIGTVTAAHIHVGKKRKAGNPVLLLPVGQGQSGDPGAFSFCVPTDSGTYNFGLDLNRLRKSPERFYVNVHTTAFPNGAIRGQIRRQSPDQG